MNAIVSAAVGRFSWSESCPRPRPFGMAAIVALVTVPFLCGLSLSSCAAPIPDSPEVQDGQEAQEAQEVQEVEEVARAFLEALSQTDTAALRSLMASDVSLSSVRGGPQGPVVRHSTGEDFLRGLGGEDQNLLERMWDPTVHVQDRVAVVWTPYDFFLNGEFSHCGIDVFTMLKGEDGWRVTGVTYNVIQEGCSPSPLGPPGG